MWNFIIGALLGATLGFLVAALACAASKANHD